MEVFKMFGTIALKGVDEVNRQLKNVTGQAQKSESIIGKVLKSIAKAVGIGFGVHQVVQFGKSVISTTQSFSDAMLKVQSLSGASAEELQKLNDTALDYGSKTAWTSSQVADAMGYMALAGFDTNEIMESLGGTLSLASASGTDLAVASDILTDSLTAFGYSAKDANLFANVLSTTQAKSNTTVEMLGEAFKYVGTLAGSYGYSIEDVSSALGLMANSGIKGSMAGTSLSAVITRLATNTNGARDMIEKLGISFYNSDGTARNLGDVITELCLATEGMTASEKASIASKIAGQEAQKGLLAILNQGAETYNELNGTLKQCDNSANEMANTMESGMGGAMRSMQSAWEGFKIKLGQKIEPYITVALHNLANFVNNNLVPAMNGLIDTIGNVINWFKEHKTVTTVLTTAIIAITSALLAYKGVMVASTIVTKAISLAQSAYIVVLDLWALATGKVTLANSVLNGVLLANPVGLVIAGITALIAIGVVLYKKCDGFKKFIDKMWKGITDGFNSVVDFFKNNWQTIGLFLLNPFAGAFKLLYDKCEKFRNFWDNLLDKIKGAWNSFTDFFKNGIKLPHFKFSGSLNPAEWLKGNAPKIGVEWYANGGIMTKPTVFGINPNNGNAMVGGEAGAEAIAPIDKLQGYVSEAVEEKTNELSYQFDKLIDMLSQFLPQIVDGMDRDIILDSGALVGSTASKMDEKLGTIANTKARYGV